MSDVNDIPKDLTFEQVVDGIEKFVITIEEEVEIHHSHPEWMDFDERCREEVNLLIRAAIIMDMLEGAIKHFNIPEDHDLHIRIIAARDYFETIDQV
ncbi:MAG: hypothetical protein KDF58_00390 [Alphaproteobacteria bacterium]|nr:hypothetical protein [Alphaproteobacteria bacterium]HPF47192.1 hypothetical protein [Emcibacteraceae bacterium]HRW30837.1 hypothetical protein [Emcibacteraceae bacterium]